MKRTQVTILLAIALMTISWIASATTSVTPFGPADDSCVREVPRGAVVDADTGNISLSGAIVDHVAACTTSPFTLQRPTANATAIKGGGHPPASGGWYAWSVANATTISGLTQFDELEVDWWVPTTPGTYDSSFQYMFPSLQNGNGCQTTAIIQPVLQFGYDGFFGGNEWEIASWAVWNCDSNCQNCSILHSTPEVVSEYDQLRGLMEQTSSNEWYIYTGDISSSAWTSMYFDPPSGAAKFSNAEMGVLEAYGLSSTCGAELSTDNTVEFDLDYVYEGGPYWNSFNDVSPGEAHAISWSTGVTSSLSPSCSWNATVSGGTSTDLDWVE